MHIIAFIYYKLYRLVNKSLRLIQINTRIRNIRFYQIIRKFKITQRTLEILNERVLVFLIVYYLLCFYTSLLNQTQSLLTNSSVSVGTVCIFSTALSQSRLQVYQAGSFFVFLGAERRFLHAQQVAYRIEIVRLAVLLTYFFLRKLVPIVDRKRSTTESTWVKDRKKNQKTVTCVFSRYRVVGGGGGKKKTNGGVEKTAHLADITNLSQCDLMSSSSGCSTMYSPSNSSRLAISFSRLNMASGTFRW